MPISGFHRIISLYFSLKKYCSEGNIHYIYIYRNMLWVIRYAEYRGGKKPIIFPEEGG